MIDYIEDHVGIASKEMSEVMSFNSFVYFYQPSSWVGPIHDFVSVYNVSLEEYNILKENQDISSILDYDNAFYYQEAVISYFKKENNE